MYKIYAISDSKMEAFNRPFVLPADGAAIRAFQDEINNKDSELSKHPKDYDLYCVGLWDEETGIISECKTKLIAAGESLIYRKDKE